MNSEGKKNIGRGWFHVMGWILLFGLGVMWPMESVAQPCFFDSNGNGYIDDEELLIIINYWAQHRPFPTPAVTPTPTPPGPTGDTMTVMLPGDVSLELVKIPGGEGIVNGQTVRLSEFWMGKYEITQTQWEAVMGENPSYFKGPNRPVEQVSWNDCQEFVTALIVLGHGGFSLPSEAQWEYACRAGTDTTFFWGEDEGVAAQYAWYSANSGKETHDVGTRRPNPWGLYDMTGNVWEWCEDAYDASSRVLRGGSWYYASWSLPSASRPWYTPGATTSGFAWCGLRNTWCFYAFTLGSLTLGTLARRRRARREK